MVLDTGMIAHLLCRLYSGFRDKVAMYIVLLYNLFRWRKGKKIFQWFCKMRFC